MMFFAPVEEVSIYRTSAVVRRKTVIPLQAGVNEAVLSGISGTAAARRPFSRTAS